MRHSIIISPRGKVSHETKARLNLKKIKMALESIKFEMTYQDLKLTSWISSQ